MAKKKHSFAWVPIRRLMRQQGASIVARNAVNLLIDNLEETALKLTEKAKPFMIRADRKKVTEKDLLSAARLL